MSAARQPCPPDERPAPRRESPRSTPRWKTWLGIAVPLIAVGALFAVAHAVDLDPLLTAVRGWVRHLGYWAPLAFVGVYVGAMLVALPGTPLTILAAVLFGNAWGFAVMVVATTIAAAAAFLIARHGARGAIERRLERFDALRRLDALVDESHRFVIPAVHLAPFAPFALTNYGFGLTKIGFWRYMLWSELVMIPMNAVWVLGTNAVFGAAMRKGSWGFTGIMIGASVVVFGMGWIAKRYMNGKGQKPG